MSLSDDKTYKFSYSTDGVHFTQIQEKFPLSRATWTGAKLCLWSCSKENKNSEGYCDYEYVTIVWYMNFKNWKLKVCCVLRRFSLIGFIWAASVIMLPYQEQRYNRSCSFLVFCSTHVFLQHFFWCRVWLRNGKRCIYENRDLNQYEKPEYWNIAIFYREW